MSLPTVSNRRSLILRGASHQRGVGMVEVLVAVLVMAIGLLGIALMQTRALSSNNSSMARSTAVIASYSILETMRADRPNVLAGAYNVSMTGNTCNAGTGTSYATTQLVKWCNDLATKLIPPSSTSATINCNTSGVCTVTLTFDDSRAGKDGSSASTVSSTVVTKVAL